VNHAIRFPLLWILQQIFFYRVRSLALCPASSLEDHALIYLRFPSDMVAQLRPRALGSLFIRLLLIVELEWRYSNPLPRWNINAGYCDLIMNTRFSVSERSEAYSEIMALRRLG
jgi:hypothetical protein